MSWQWLDRHTEGSGVDNSEQVPMQRGTTSEVPRWIAELAYRVYGASYRQDLETLLRRGGFGAEEVIGYLAAEVLRGEEARRAEERLRLKQTRELRERNQLLESCVRGLVRVMVEQLGAAKNAEAFVRTRDAARLVGEELR